MLVNSNSCIYYKSESLKLGWILIKAILYEIMNFFLILIQM